MERLAEKYGHPESAYKTIHIAGTNGKGSVSTKIAAALQAEGYKVGLYTSPHITSFTERIRINGTPIAEEALLKWLPDNEEGSFFEITTLLAFRYFEAEKVDYAVIETGLGGRLDATNIIRPLLAIITSISLDHTDLLGETLEAIAAEKGGILKPGVPAIVGPTANYYENVQVVEGQFSSFDAENSAIAEAALKILGVSDAALQKGLLAMPPCRMESIGNRVILDVAHNQAGFEKLAQAFCGQKVNICLALSKNKDIQTCLKLLKPIAKNIIATSSSNIRTLSAEALKDELVRAGYSEGSLHLCPSPSEAVKLGLSLEGKLLITGSFFIMAEARESALKLDQKS
jgi:dihydrofolate synthase/folylpolyglutamate synthase